MRGPTVCFTLSDGSTLIVPRDVPYRNPMRQCWEANDAKARAAELRREADAIEQAGARVEAEWAELMAAARKSAT